ncbi:MAG: fructose-1,6-bisphosphatase [Bacteroidales bacterium]|nr:fructose-1,6-bisphosphatase [Bacteroidales bacterium]MDD4685527.1 fructose-1,6-bisphosphatase [Bacteroidales bacterium]
MNTISNEELKFLQGLSKNFPTVQSASTEIINLEAIQLLPKGTEHYVTDIHGEYDTFNHILSNASGSVKRKIDFVFGNRITKAEKNQLATIIYYPNEKLRSLIASGVVNEEWYSITLNRLVEVAKEVTKKYTRSKVRKAMPQEYAFIIDELLNETNPDKQNYYDSIIKSIINLKRSDYFIESICVFIKRMLIDRLHIIGDIYDRGPKAVDVVEKLKEHHSVDIQWGNHDIIWMGAACGNKLDIAEVIRLTARYGSLDTIEDDYGINLMSLVSFALSTYENDPAIPFIPKGTEPENYEDSSVRLMTIIHKAIAIIAFKLEGQLIKRNPQFDMNHRLLLDKVDYDKGTITIEGKTYELLDKEFPTIDPKDPYKLTPEEEFVMDKLKYSFLNSYKMQDHIAFLFAKGSIYLTYNNNLMLHGCIPMKSATEFREFNHKGKMVKGKELCDVLEKTIRNVWLNRNDTENNSNDGDYFWYLWCGPVSPIFGKHRMATYERYLIDDKEQQKEILDIYFKLRNEEPFCEMILNEFGLNNKSARIINGHIPVKVKKGESPILANGRLLVIDGGMSKAYQKTTGIGGYTLIYSSIRMFIVQHEPFSSRQEAIENESDIISKDFMIESHATPILVKDTEVGAELYRQIDDLKMLIKAYNSGLIKEK